MNVYDFDGTIYAGDSSVDFIRYCMEKNKVCRSKLFSIIIGAVKYKAKVISTKDFKELFFSCITLLPENDRENLISNFWKRYYKNIQNWYINQRKDSDIIVSATPSFVLEPVKTKLGIQRIIATEFDVKTGKIIGENCKGEEKTTRFLMEYPDTVIDNFYSDTDSDFPMAKISKNAYKVNNGKIHAWKI